MGNNRDSKKGIPPIIHYCWFGPNPKPEVFDQCLASWKKYMPDCQIIEWNESNTDLDSCQFLRDAYDNQKWAFVSDVVRLMAVWQMGGIYMDTDVELYQSLEEYMGYEGFLFFQNYSQINTGLGFGACAGNALLADMIKVYGELAFDPNQLQRLACPLINTDVICRRYPAFEPVCKTQVHENMIFVHYEDYYSRACHYGEFSWVSQEQRQALKYAKKKHGHWKLKRKLRNPEIFRFLEQHKLSAVAKIYGFLVCDFVDFGARYWMFRAVQKIRKHMKNLKNYQNTG